MTMLFGLTFFISLIIGAFVLHPIIGIIVLSFIGFVCSSALGKYL